jgi:hypothetical protein
MSLIIDGTTYAIPVIELTRTADVLDKYAERTNDGILHREIIGVYFNYKLKLGSTTDTVAYAALWQKLSEPTEFHTVTLPAESGSFTFKAYFSKVGDTLSKQKTANVWKNLVVDFIAQAPART